MSEPLDTPPLPVSRRRFLAHVAAAAAAPGIAVFAADEALAAAKAHAAKKHAPPAAAPGGAPAETTGFPRPDFAVAKSPAEHEALERQWKQMVELVTGLRKVEVPVGSEIATGALAPLKLRREAN